MRIEAREVRTGDLKPYPGNPRRNDGSVDAVAESIRLFGFRQPIVADRDMVIVCGHARWKAARKLGMETVPVVVRDDMSPEEARAFRLADNRTGELSAWDGGLLSDELEALKGEFDFRSLGFGDAEYRRLLDRLDPLSVTEDAWKPGGDVPGVSPGDAFRLGDHLVVCGEPDPSRMPERAACAFCETPEGDETPWEALVSMSDGAVYAAFPPERLGSAKDAFERAGGHWSDFVLWARGGSFTPVLYGWREGSPRRWCGDRDQGDVWRTAGGKPGDGLPVGIAARILRNSSLPGDTVLDPALSRGTDLVACEQSGRRLVAFGKPPACAAAIARWEAFTGKMRERAT